MVIGTAFLFPTRLDPWNCSEVRFAKFSLAGKLWGWLAGAWSNYALQLLLWKPRVRDPGKWEGLHMRTRVSGPWKSGLFLSFCFLEVEHCAAFSVKSCSCVEYLHADSFFSHWVFGLLILSLSSPWIASVCPVRGYVYCHLKCPCLALPCLMCRLFFHTHLTPANAGNPLTSVFSLW